MEQSCPWIGQPTGWVGSIFKNFWWVGLVHRSESTKAQKLNICTLTEFIDTDGHRFDWVGSWVQIFTTVWVGLDRSFGGLGLVKLDPWKTLRWECVRYLYVPPKGGSKSNFLVVFLNKIQFQSNKVCYKVSLCENFQQRSCSITIPPSNSL